MKLKHIILETEFKGSLDGGPPENYDSETLSRVHDMVELARQIGGQRLAQSVFQQIPKDMRLEFIYSRWKYTPSH